jgi:hypothetical protein
MRDWKRDWRRWSRGERVLAVTLALLMLVALPMGVLGQGVSAPTAAESATR